MNQEEEEPPSQKPSRPPHPRARTSLRKSTLPASAKGTSPISYTVRDHPDCIHRGSNDFRHSHGTHGSHTSYRTTLALLDVFESQWRR